MGKKQSNEVETYEGINAGQAMSDYTTEELMELLGGGRSAWTHKGEFRSIGDLPESAAAAYESYLDYRLSMDARDYNSVGQQVQRLMAAGMSRTQALLTATAGEATPPVTADLATAVNSEKTRKRDTAFGILDSFQQMLGSAQDFINGYDSFQQVRGDALVQPVGEEIYSWLPRGIVVPDLARADAQHFKQWLLGTLKDENGNVIPCPEEAAKLIHSKEWRRMAASPAGWLAFEKYFNANYSTRGYHEDFYDAVRQRNIERMGLAAARMDMVIKSPQFLDANLEMVNQALRGTTVSLNSLMEDGNTPTFNINIKGHEGASVDYSGTTGLVNVYDKDGNQTYSGTPAGQKKTIGCYFIDPQGNFYPDAADRLREFAFLYNEQFMRASFLGSRDHLQTMYMNLLDNDKLTSAMLELSLICKDYQKRRYQQGVESLNDLEGPAKWFYDTASNLLIQYEMLTNGRDLLDDGSGLMKSIFK